MHCVCGIYVLSIRSTLVGVLGDALCVSGCGGYLGLGSFRWRPDI